MIRMEFSNKTLAWLVVATIVVSLAGTLISVNRITQGPTGFATANATGNATVSISSVTQLNFVVSAVDFGAGQVWGNVTTGYHCNLTINGTQAITKTAGCNGFNSSNTAGPLVLENTGNTPLNVTLNFSANATNFIGGGGGINPGPSFKFLMSENETTSCPGLNGTLAVWTEVNESQNYRVCQGATANMLQYGSATDTLSIGISISIPSNAAGTKNVTIFAQGTS
jgi:hypothetical protein